MGLAVVCGLWTCSTMSRAADGALASVCKIHRICYRGGSCYEGFGVGVWALYLDSDASVSSWSIGFRLK